MTSRTSARPTDPDATPASGDGHVADSHGGLLRAAFGNDDFQRFQQALRAYDFDDAAPLLIHSCRRHGVALPAES